MPDDIEFPSLEHPTPDWLVEMRAFCGEIRSWSSRSESPWELDCESCSKSSYDDHQGWRARHGRDDNDQVVIVVLCPDCAEEVDDSKVPTD